MRVVRLGRRAMGTVFEILVLDEDEVRARTAAEAALDEVARLEDQLSVFLPTSEVSRVNRLAADGPVRLEPGLAGLLLRALGLWEETEGAFDPTVGAWLDAWGFRGSPQASAKEARRATGFDLVDLADGCVSFAARGLALDLGAIGKGHALDRATDRLRRHGIARAFLHAGSSTAYALGSPPGAEGWTVGLVDPAEAGTRLGTLRLRDRALSTSSGHGRTVEAGGRTIGHVLDPRTGEPATARAAWAVAPSATESDALATAFLVGGQELIERVLGRRDDVGALLLEEDLASFALAPTFRAEPRRREGLDRRAILKGALAATAAITLAPDVRTARAEKPPREVRVALVGVGEHGLLLLGQLVRMPGVKVVALADPRKAARQAGIQVAGRTVETYEDPRYLLEEEEVEAVVVATPTYVHAEICLAALEAGTHVFCEAPLVHRVADGKRVVRAAEASGRVFQVGHQRRTNKLYPLALEHAESGAIGDILQIRAEWNQKRSWRRATTESEKKALDWRLYRETSGGLVLEQGSHAFDLANWFMGTRPEAVSGMGATLLWKDGREVEDVVQVSLVYPGGRLLQYAASLAGSYGDARELIVGSGASILVLGQHKGLLFKEADTAVIGWEAYAKKEMLGDRRGIVLDADATKYASHERPELVGPEADKADFFAELEAFFACVREGKAPACDARRGFEAAAVGVVAAEAVRKRATLPLTPELYEV